MRCLWLHVLLKSIAKIFQYKWFISSFQKNTSNIFGNILDLVPDNHTTRHSRRVLSEPAETSLWGRGRGTSILVLARGRCDRI